MYYINNVLYTESLEMSGLIFTEKNIYDKENTSIYKFRTMKIILFYEGNTFLIRNVFFFSPILLHLVSSQTII